ncbi:MAG: hypothetical protein QME47_04330 [Candidatus Thermoplasmatota archaeon]|nr:hypothetical protein [Candidatus Thermoplasmatota archaeon]
MRWKTSIVLGTAFLIVGAVLILLEFQPKITVPLEKARGVVEATLQATWNLGDYKKGDVLKCEFKATPAIPHVIVCGSEHFYIAATNSRGGYFEYEIPHNDTWWIVFDNRGNPKNVSCTYATEWEGVSFMRWALGTLDVMVLMAALIFLLVGVGIITDANIRKRRSK